MAKCKTCINRKTIDGGMWCDKVSDSYDVDVVRGCEHYKCMTNGDRIRKMSDEELADFLCKVKSDYQWLDHEFPSEEESEEWVEWLQSEVEE